ncbi:MAG: DUF1559 domain-containing protein [Gemmataceae bacterium]
MAARRCGVSMISVVVLLGLVILLLAMLFPALARLRSAAKTAQSINNMKQLGIAVHSYHDAFNSFPPLVGGDKFAKGSLHLHLLPFLEQDALFKQGKDDWTEVMHRPVPLFTDDADPTAPPGHVFNDSLATTNYAGNWKFFRDGGMTFANIPDGLSNTLMFTTRYQTCKGDPTAWAYNRLYYWAPMYAFYSHARFQLAPDKDACDSSLPQALSADGILAGLGDGSVRTISGRCSPLTWRLANDPADGMPLGDDFN